MFYNIDNCDITSYADDNTSYTSDFNLEEVMQKLGLFTNSYSYLLVTRDTDGTAKIGEFDVKNSREKKLGVKIDTKFSFENHVSSLCKKASQKLHALARVINFGDLAKRKSLMKAFITAQFNYCPLIWMLHSRQLHNRINKIHKRTLKLVYKNNKLTYYDLLKLDNQLLYISETFRCLQQKYSR